MLKQKEFDLIVEKFSQNNMEGYKEWFDKNVNCEVNVGIQSGGWRKGIRLHSVAKKYVVIAIEGLDGLALKVALEDFRMIESK